MDHATGERSLGFTVATGFGLLFLATVAVSGSLAAVAYFGILVFGSIWAFDRLGRAEGRPPLFGDTELIDAAIRTAARLEASVEGVAVVAAIPAVDSEPVAA